jgi:octaprenyl-diphosphate synthase
MAFQLVDDVLDYVGDAEALGKNIGDDIAEGKTTLPLIHAMKHGSKEQSALIRQAIRKGGTENLAQIVVIVQECGAINYTNNKALEHVKLAQQAINGFTQSSAKDALYALAELAVARSN